MRQYGIRITLPPNSTMTTDRLLGKNWEAFRWYATEDQRDVAMADMHRQPGNYRIGDDIQQILEKVER